MLVGRARPCQPSGTPPVAGSRPSDVRLWITDSATAASATVRAVRTDRVLRVRDRHDAGAAGQPDRRLDADDAVGVGRADDAAVGLGAERHGGEVRGRRRARSGARAAGVAIDAVRIVGLSADRRTSR